MTSRSFRGVWRCGDVRFEAAVILEKECLVGTVRSAGVPDDEADVDAWVSSVVGREVKFLNEGRAVRAFVVREGGRFHVALEGEVYVLEPVDEHGGAAHAAAEEPFATSPMTGTVAKVSVAPGAAAAKGAELFVVEAMKMEYVVRAPRDVTVAEVRRAAGERVALGDVVVTFAEAS